MKKFLKYCLVAVMTLGLAACSSSNGGEVDTPKDNGDTPSGDEKLEQIVDDFVSDMYMVEEFV